MVDSCKFTQGSAPKVLLAENLKPYSKRLGVYEQTLEKYTIN